MQCSSYSTLPLGASPNKGGRAIPSRWQSRRGGLKQHDPFTNLREMKPAQFRFRSRRFLLRCECYCCGLLLAVCYFLFNLQASPLSLEQERASFHLADDSLAVELVCSEPNVLSLVSITWDAKGRMFVAEMIDYPLGPGSGQVRLLEDLDGDGFYEKSTVFADKLAF